MSSILSKISDWFTLSKDNLPEKDLVEQGTGFGLKKGEVKLVDIDLGVWKKNYLVEKEAILKGINVSADELEEDTFSYEEGRNITITHSGSTSFNKIKAKPILDVLIGFKNREELLKAKDRLLKSNRGQLRVLMTPGAFGFYLIGKLDGDRIIAHYHLAIIGSKAYKDHNDIQFMLRNNFKILKEYEQLKVNLSVKYKNNRFAYTTNKKDFLHAVIFRKQLADQRILLNKYSRI